MQTDRQEGRKSGSQADWKEGLTNTQAGRQADRETERQEGRQTGREEGRQSDR